MKRLALLAVIVCAVLLFVFGRTLGKSAMMRPGTSLVDTMAQEPDRKSVARERYITFLERKHDRAINAPIPIHPRISRTDFYRSADDAISDLSERIWLLEQRVRELESAQKSD